MPVKLNSTGGGSVTLDVGSTATNFTQTLPSVTTTLVGTDSTQTLSNKTFSGATTFGSASLAAPDGSAPLYMARAWVNFNGTSTVAIRASGNVSSITDNGTGRFAINFTNAMPDTNYTLVGTTRRSDSADVQGIFTLNPTSSANTNYPFTTTTANVVTGYSSGGQFVDHDVVCAVIFR